MPLVEVSEYYFAACEGTVYFFEADFPFRNKVDSVYSKNSAKFAHCHNLDRAPRGGFSTGMERHRMP